MEQIIIIFLKTFSVAYTFYGLLYIILSIRKPGKLKISKFGFLEVVQLSFYVASLASWHIQ